MKKPNEFLEVFMSLVKWFLAFVIVNNLIWGLVMYSLVADTSTEINQTQDGTNNYQEMTNG